MKVKFTNKMNFARLEQLILSESEKAHGQAITLKKLIQERGTFEVDLVDFSELDQTGDKSFEWEVAEFALDQYVHL